MLNKKELNNLFRMYDLQAARAKKLLKTSKNPVYMILPENVSGGTIRVLDVSFKEIGVLTEEQTYKL